MRGIFRITRAEFNKIFKKPAVYIMAVVLVLACLLSLFLFEPTVRQYDKVELSKDSAQKNYTLFTTDNSDESKSQYDKTLQKAFDEISKAEKQTEQYSLLQKYNTSIDIYYDKISSANYTQQDIDDFKSALYNLSTFFKFDDHSDYESYIKDILNSKRIKVDFNTNNYEQTDNSYVKELQDKLTNIYDQINSKTNKNDITNLIDNNHLLTEIHSTADNVLNFIPYTLDCIVEDIKNVETIYKNFYSQNSNNTSPVSISNGKTMLELINNKINEFQKITDSIITQDNKIALVSASNKKRLSSVIIRVQEITKITDSDNVTNTKLKDIASQLNNDNYLNQLSSYLDLLIYIDYSDNNFIKELNTLKEKVEKNQNLLNIQIEELKNDVSTTEICDSITSYKLMCESFNSLINNLITKHNLSGLSQKEIVNLEGYDLSEYNEYNLNNSITYDTYYLNTNTYSNQYLNTFDYNTTIDYETSAYDYIYSSLKICAFLIIVFTMMMAGYLISSEYDSGTIKLLIMRPYKRTKILIAKMLATLFFALTFLLLGLVISAVGGILSFGLPTLSKVLVSFNSTKIFATSPIILLLIYLGSVILDILFFLIIAYFVAIVFKSFAGTISVSFITILATIVLNLSLSNSVAYKFIPFTNTSLFRFFGRSVTANEGLLAALLSTPIQSSMNIWLSLIVTVLFSFVLYLITRITFKKRDF